MDKERGRAMKYADILVIRDVLIKKGLITYEDFKYLEDKAVSLFMEEGAFEEYQQAIKEILE